MFEGLPLVDATNDIAIVINKTDVTVSKKKSPESCAAALAGRRELKTDVRVFMSRMYVKDTKRKCWIRFLTPTSISREITAFDRGAAFEPGEYIFKAPTPGQVLGSHRRGGTNTGKEKKKNQPLHKTVNVRIHAKERMK